jgi:hypothetical protein
MAAAMPMTQLQAAEAGLTIYESAKACRTCGTCERYVTNSSCVACAKAAAGKRRTAIKRALKRARKSAQQPAQSMISEGGLPPQAGTGSGRRSAPSKTGGES